MVWCGPAEDGIRCWVGTGDGDGDDDPGAGRTSCMFTVEMMLVLFIEVSQTGGRRDVSDKLLLRASGIGVARY